MEKVFRFNIYQLINRYRKVTDIMAVIKSVEEKYMKEALKQAKKAYALGEVPIGCVIVHEGKIIGRGYNRRNTDKNTLAHAEDRKSVV